MYFIEPIFFIFPILALFCSYLTNKNSKIIYYLLLFAYILLYSLSLNGSDLVGYEKLYEEQLDNDGFTGSHGEIGYIALMQFSIFLGLDYLLFRVIFLSFCTFILFKNLSKISNNYPFSAFLISTLFVIYTISTYRQFFVMAGFLYSLCLYKNGKRISALLVSSILLFIHITAVFPLSLLLTHYIIGNRKCIVINKLYTIHFFKILCMLFSIRMVLSFLMAKGILVSWLQQLVGIHAIIEYSLINYGLVARIIFLYFVTRFYNYTEITKDNTFIETIYWMYCMGLSIYIMVPLEFIMGRLVNNVHYLLSLLIPLLYGTGIHSIYIPRNRIGILKMYKLLIILASLMILTNQMLNQDGYTPYDNYLKVIFI